jgi:hypothetical protein
MNETAVPWPASTRSSMPIATAPSHAAAPEGRIAAGLRHARAASQPAASPARNGQAVLATPPRVSPLAWLALPITTNSSTQQMSAAAARTAERMTATLPVQPSRGFRPGEPPASGTGEPGAGDVRKSG